MCQMLVLAGANVNAVSEFGETALSEAVAQDNKKLALYLLKKGAKTECFEP